MNHFRHIRLLLVVLFLLSAVAPVLCADISIAVVEISGDYGSFFEKSIRAELAKIPEIQVVEAKRELLEKYSKRSRMSHAFPTKILSAIGEEMGVDYVISGHQIDQSYLQASGITREKTFLTLRLIQVKNQNNMAWIVNRIPRYPRGYYSKIDVMTYDLISRLANEYPFLRAYAIRDSMVDPRDGQRYKTIRVRDQVIFAENLNFDAGQGSYCYEDDPKNCEKYGRLYTWDAAMAGDSSSNEIPSGVQGVCPEGWHLPSHAELRKLEDYIFYKTEKSKKIIEESFSLLSPHPRTNYKPAWNGNSVYGVPAVDGGYRTSTGEYKYRGRSNHWWSATAGRVGTAKEEFFQDKNLKEKKKVIEVVSDSLAKKKTLFDAKIIGDNSQSIHSIFESNHDNKNAACSVRCIMNQTDNVDIEK